MKTKIMAILNVTPDSFYSNSRVQTQEAAVERALQFALEEGADIIDIGGESTRPNSDPVSEREEIERVIPVIQALRQQHKLAIPISIDTMKPKVAELALDAGATMINDVTGFQDPQMRRIARESGCDVCIMHMLGRPKTMQDNPFYERGVVAEVMEWLEMQAKTLLHDGIEHDKIILDPGIGFGKTVDDNLQILAHIEDFKSLGYKLLVGVSRKSFMSKLLNRPTNELLAATLAANIMLMLSQVDYVRVHDVKAHHDAFNMVRAVPKKTQVSSVQLSS